MTLRDVQVEVSIVVGTASLPIRQLLKLGRGAVIPLDAKPEDLVTVYANAEPIAVGNIETADGHLKVRVERRLSRRTARMGAAA